MAASAETQALLQSLVGTRLATTSGQPNMILRVDHGEVVVATTRSPDGRPVPIECVELGLKRLYDEGEVEISVPSLGHRSSFVGAVLLRVPGAVLVSTTPPRVRLTGATHADPTAETPRVNAWWSGDPSERFGLEITDRPDLGADLHCPQRDAIGNRSPGYSLIWWVQPGDIVFHYDRRARTISCWSRAVGSVMEAPTVWLSHRGDTRRRLGEAQTQPGWWLDLEGAFRLANPLTLLQLRLRGEEIKGFLSDLQSRYAGSLYFPFFFWRGRELRPMQPYLNKLPAGVVAMFPQLAAVAEGTSSGAMSPSDLSLRSTASSRLVVNATTEHTARSRESPSTSAAIQTLEQELADVLVASRLSPRQADGVAARLGWDGKGGLTLDAAGAVAGVTRERLRQLERRVDDHVSSTNPSLPTLTAAANLLAANVPITRMAAARLLKKDGLSRSLFDPAGVVRGLDMLGDAPLVVVGSAVFPKGKESDVSEILSVARKLVTHHGAGNVTTLVDLLADDGLDPALARRYLDLDDSLVWLDAEQEWFFLQTTRNRAANHIRKMFSVAESLTLNDLRAGCRRPAGREVTLSSDVLRGLCKALGWIAVDGDVATTLVDLDYIEVLENTEETLVEVFRALGPVLDRQTALDAAIDRGLDRTTAGLYLHWSPVIQRIAQNRYALRGTDIPAGTLEAMRAPQRRRVLLDYGWTTDGRLRIVYRISQGVLDSKVVGVPGGLKNELSGRFVIESDHASGELATDGANAWGFGTMLRQSGAEVGDVLALEFDLAAHCVRVAVGGDDLLDRLDERSAGSGHSGT